MKYRKIAKRFVTSISAVLLSGCLVLGMPGLSVLAETQSLGGTAFKTDEDSQEWSIHSYGVALEDMASEEPGIYGANPDELAEDGYSPVQGNNLGPEAYVYLSDCYDVKMIPDKNAETVVTVYSGQTVYVDSMDFYADEAWFGVTFYYGNSWYSGYIEERNLAYSDSALLAWREENLGSEMPILTSGPGVTEDIAQFPVSYQRKLAQLKASFPNWVFVKQYTGLYFDTVVYNEVHPQDRSMIYKSYPDSWKNGATGQPNWYYASEGIVRYFLDSRNFLNHKDIFQFEQATYNGQYHTFEGVNNILSGSFMETIAPGDTRTYAQIFYEVGTQLGVSPYHIAIRVLQEQGSAGTSPLISGTVSGYEGYYNYFNVGASGNTVSDVIHNGLEYAKSKNWSSVYDAIYGGVSFLAQNYILRGQDSLYLQKWNVNGTNNGSQVLYYHQYAQDVRYAYSQGRKVYQQYETMGILNNIFVFKIPVYADMPWNACPQPSEFPDVDASSWQYPYVSYVNTNGVMAGKATEQGLIFDPNANLTRAEFAMVIYSSAGKPEIEYTPLFEDVPDGQWYSQAVTWAVNNGIVSGYGDGLFGPEDLVTREQMMQMLYKFAVFEGLDTNSDLSQLEQFADKDTISGWAVNAIAWAVPAGVISGKAGDNGNEIAPTDCATRAECAAILYRYLALY